MNTFDETQHPREHASGRFATKTVDEADGGLGALAPFGTEALVQDLPRTKDLSDAERGEYDRAHGLLVEAWEREQYQLPEGSDGTISVFRGRREALSELSAVLADPTILDGHETPAARVEHIELVAEDVAQLARHRFARGRLPQAAGLDEDRRADAIDHFADQLAHEQEWWKNGAKQELSVQKSMGRLCAYADATAALVYPDADERAVEDLSRDLINAAIVDQADSDELAQRAHAARHEHVRGQASAALGQWTQAVDNAYVLRKEARATLDQALAAGAPNVGELKAHHAKVVAYARFADTMETAARGSYNLARADELVHRAHKEQGPGPGVGEEDLVEARSLVDALTSAEHAARSSGRRNTAVITEARERAQSAVGAIERRLHFMRL